MIKSTDKNKLLAKNLSSFMQNIIGIERVGDAANVIISYEHGDIKKPIRLIGFRTKASLTDLEICEEAYIYYKELYTLLKY